MVAGILLGRRDSAVTALAREALNSGAALGAMIWATTWRRDVDAWAALVLLVHVLAVWGAAGLDSARCLVCASADPALIEAVREMAEGHRLDLAIRNLRWYVLCGLSDKRGIPCVLCVHTVE